MVLSSIIEKVTILSPVSLVIALVVIIATIVYFSFSWKGLPPGPTGVPILGYWPFLNEKTSHLKLQAMKEKYGDVFSFTCSGSLYVNLGSVKAIREAHITKADCFGSRVTQYCLLTRSFEDGVSFCNGEPWKVLRKYFLQVMKERGLISIKDSMSGSLYNSINTTIEHLRSKNGEPVNFMLLLTEKCNTIFRETLFGVNGITDEQVREINEYYAALMESMTSTNLLLTGNIAKILFFLMPTTRKGLQNLKYIEKYLYKIIDDHKSSYNEDHMRDIIDEYLKERNLRKSKGDPTAYYFTDKALMASLVQFVGDGVLSVAAFVAAFLSKLAEYPKEQDKIYQELVDVVGVDRQPAIEDKSKLNYTNAFILEVLRFSNFLGFFPSQECTKETTLRGFRIPVGTITLINTWSAHNDTEIYEEPEKFDPSRFISKDGKRRPELPITFGIGRRACIGEGFTMVQIFLFLTTIVKNFHLTMSKTSDDPLSDLVQGKLEMCAIPRSQQ